MNLCVVGTGYVGLVTGTCFAEKGNNVWCVDLDQDRIGELNRDIVPIYENGLRELVARNRALGRLHFTTDLSEGLEESNLCFIAVGTPPGEDGGTDMAQVLAVADQIGHDIAHPCFIVVKSTVPVGTNRLLCDKIGSLLRERGIENSVEIISNPEFLKEGMAVDDCLHPDRIVVGVASERARAVMRELYLPFVSSGEQIIFMDPASAEITKYAANAMLAARISFMNEMAALCDAVGADICRVKDGIASDRRIGPYFLNAGCGYGGSCFPKDVQSLGRVGDGYELDMAMVQAIEKVNRRQKKHLFTMLRKRFGESMEGKRIAVLGLAFKPQTDDVREAPSLSLISSLLEYGAVVVACDPIARRGAEKLLPREVCFAEDALEAAAGADAIALVTEWPEFVSLDWAEAAARMRQKIIFDGRNVLDPEQMTRLGFEYYCIGRNRKP